MLRLKLSLRKENGVRCPLATKKRIRRAAVATLKAEGHSEKCELSVLITDDDGIQLINAQQRNIDSPTDVLSFPMGIMDYTSGRFVLGDMVLNLDRAQKQGEEFGHGTEREISYLTVHSVLHLLGYDHMDEGEEKKKMRSREKYILKGLGLEDD